MDKLPEEVPIPLIFKVKPIDWDKKKWGGINAIYAFLIGVGLCVVISITKKLIQKKKITSVSKPVSAIRIITSLFFVGIYAICNG